MREKTVKKIIDKKDVIEMRIDYKCIAYYTIIELSRELEIHKSVIEAMYNGTVLDMGYSEYIKSKCPISALEDGGLERIDEYYNNIHENNNYICLIIKKERTRFSKSMAKKYNVAPSTIHNILKYKTRKSKDYITEELEHLGDLFKSNKSFYKDK